LLQRAKKLIQEHKQGEEKRVFKLQQQMSDLEETKNKFG
jgi:hypothetical protein